MKTRLFYTDGKQNIIHEVWDKPEPESNQIEVKAIYTGICRSDLDMHCGKFQLLPKYIHGHEGLGQVTKIGSNIENIQIGDFVATRGEPAFADYYNCTAGMFVQIPETSPKYIIEPVACAINIANSINIDTPDDILIMGSGFLATIVHQMLDRYYTNKCIVVGSANEIYWKNAENVQVKTASNVNGTHFKYVFDLSEKPDYLNLDIFAERAKIVIAAEKHPNVNTSFANLLWKACTIIFPSPRNESFYSAMKLAVTLLEEDDLDVSLLWTQSYDRETEVEKAFADGINRPAGYSRGYIEWKH